MKKIITLALAAVLTLGLAVLPQAANTKAQDWADQDAKVKIADAKLTIAKQEYEAAKKLTEAKKAVYDIEKAKDQAGAQAAKTAEAKTAYEEALAAEAKAKTAVETAEKELNAEKKTLDGLDYAYVVLKDENGKVVAQGEVKAGHYTVKELLKYFNLDPDKFEYADMDEIKGIGGRYQMTVIELVKKYPVMVRAIDEEGREIGTYKANTTKFARRGWVTAKEVAAKELTFSEDTEKAIGVNGYWVLADVEENEKPQYVSTWTKGGEKFVTAVYTVQKRAKFDKKTGTTKVTKPGQVGKTGEVATVATGLGALMTLAGVVLATKRH